MTIPAADPRLYSLRYRTMIERTARLLLYGVNLFAWPAVTVPWLSKVLLGPVTSCDCPIWASRKGLSLGSMELPYRLKRVSGTLFSALFRPSYWSCRYCWRTAPHCCTDFSNITYSTNSTSDGIVRLLLVFSTYDEPLLLQSYLEGGRADGKWEQLVDSGCFMQGLF